MNHGMLGAVLLTSLVMGSAVTWGEIYSSEHARQSDFSQASGITLKPGSSWESWLQHGLGNVSPQSHVPAPSPDPDTASAPLTPSIEPEWDGLIRKPAAVRRDLDWIMSARVMSSVQKR